MAIDVLIFGIGNHHKAITTYWRYRTVRKIIDKQSKTFANTLPRSKLNMQYVMRISKSFFTLGLLSPAKNSNLRSVRRVSLSKHENEDRDIEWTKSPKKQKFFPWAGGNKIFQGGRTTYWDE